MSGSRKFQIGCTIDSETILFPGHILSFPHHVHNMSTANIYVDMVSTWCRHRKTCPGNSLVLLSVAVVLLVLVVLLQVVNLFGVEPLAATI